MSTNNTNVTTNKSRGLSVWIPLFGAILLAAVLSLFMQIAVAAVIAGAAAIVYLIVLKAIDKEGSSFDPWVSLACGILALLIGFWGITSGCLNFTLKSLTLKMEDGSNTVLELGDNANVEMNFTGKDANLSLFETGDGNINIDATEDDAGDIIFNGVENGEGNISADLEEHDNGDANATIIENDEGDVTADIDENDEGDVIADIDENDEGDINMDVDENDEGDINMDVDENDDGDINMDVAENDDGDFNLNVPDTKPTTPQQPSTPTVEDTPKHTHSYSSRVTKEATCTSTGTKTFSCSCGDSYTESIPMKDHSLGSWQHDTNGHWKQCSMCGGKFEQASHNLTTNESKATCTQPGKVTKSCSVCAYSTEEQIQATGHTFGTTWKSDDNQHWHECTLCGEKSDCSSHSWDAGRETTPATETAEGVRTYTCSVCQKTKTESIAKLPPTKGNITLEAGAPNYSMGSVVTLTVRFTTVSSLQNLKIMLNGTAVTFETVFEGSGFVSINIPVPQGTSGNVEIKALADNATEGVTYVTIQQ